jgi:spore coat protein CotH
MKKLLPFILFFCVSLTLSAQFTDSNLPIVIINTVNNNSILDRPRILAVMRIIDSGPGQRNYISDQNDLTKMNYNGNIEIEIRGSSSQTLSKKQYGLTTLQADNVSKNNVRLLGMPEENDWVLNSLPFDASLIRDHISYELSRRMGNYAPRTKYCEVIINDSYQGLYMLQEKIKIDDNRVDIIKIGSSDNTIPDVSGGYIIKADKVTLEDPSAWTMNTYLGTVTDFVHEAPNSNSITSAQHNYIKSVFDKLASTVKNTSFLDGYPAVIDLPSFVDFMLVNELSSNVDAYQFSTFFHIDKNGKLRAGPLWDLNLTYGNDLTFWGLDRSKTNVWQFQN